MADLKPVLASILTIGDELLIGQTIDTNSAWIGRELNKIGVWVKSRLAIGDNKADIRSALDLLSSSTDIVIITGGLGPTADDITKPMLCEYFESKLVVDQKVLKHIEDLFTNVYRRPGPILSRNLNQAQVPDNCTVLFNSRGTAPGMLFRKKKVMFFALPGVPYEMKGLMETHVLPLLQNELDLPVILHKTAFTAGLGESIIAERLVHFESALPDSIKLAYLPNYGMVKLRLTARGENHEQVLELAETHFSQLQELVKDCLVVNEDHPIEKVVGDVLCRRGLTVATAESCTGGYIAHLLTTIAGSSAYYKGSVISYDNEVKSDVLEVNPTTLKNHGAVSEETVREMVTGCLKLLKSDFAVATSGIMGPGGGTDKKPVGTVWLAAGNRTRTETLQLNLRFDRERNIEMAAVAALNLLRKLILSSS